MKRPFDEREDSFLRVKNWLTVSDVPQFSHTSVTFHEYNAVVGSIRFWL